MERLVTCSRSHRWEGSQAMVLWIQDLSGRSLFPTVSQQKCGRRKEGRKEDGRERGRGPALGRADPQLHHLDNSSLKTLKRKDLEQALEGAQGAAGLAWFLSKASKVRPKVAVLLSPAALVSTHGCS